MYPFPIFHFCYHLDCLELDLNSMKAKIPRKVWMCPPDSGGVKIPDTVKRRIKERIHLYAKKHFQGHFTRLEIRFHGQFCYIDAYQEPESFGPDWLTDGIESREEFQERLRNTPTHLCRLRFYGDEDRWGLAFFSYASEKYELSVFPSGDFWGTPEEAFHVSAGVYLR